MRKMILIAAAFAMTLSSCVKVEPYEPAPKTLSFEVSAVNSLNTRASLYSEEPIHEVEDVKIYVFQQSGADFLYFKTYTIPAWTKGSNYQRYDVANGDMLPAGTYRFLAVGRDATDNFTLPTLNVGSTNYNDFIVTVAAAGNETEIFAGFKEETLESEGMRVAVSMTRQVAGVLGYFVNVPAEIGGTVVRYLRLSVSDSNTAVTLPSGVGSSTAGSRNLIEMDFNGRTVNGDGAYVGVDMSPIATVANSQLAGVFVMPVSSVTLTLGLYDTDSNPLKTWSVLDENSQSQFNLVSNNFYSIGKKVANGTTTGTPTDPTPDAPVDLMRDQAITVTISPTWAAIHNMVLQ